MFDAHVAVFLFHPGTGRWLVWLAIPTSGKVERKRVRVCLRERESKSKGKIPIQNRTGRRERYREKRGGETSAPRKIW